MRTMNNSKLILLATVAVLVAAAPVIASAQTDDNGKLETVIVTARKRSEDLLKVPVAVSAFTASDIAVRGIETLDDLSNFTPGLTDDQANGGGARADRSFQQLIIRGMNPSSTLNPTTSIFINGTPVASADFLQNLDDVDRVEVLKGPQSAYFGRETFAGAVNVIAKSASNTLSANASGEIGNRRTENFSGTINVPIISDKLSIRAGYTYDHHDGSYKNEANPGQTLGDQTTKSVHVALTARPVENLTIKAFGMIFQDDDGPAATGALISTGAGAFNQGNCTVSGTPFFCGTLPGLTSASPAQNTTIVPGVNFANLSRVFLASPGGILHGGDLVNHFGLKRNAYHGDINVEYDVPSLGLSFTYLGGFNHNNWSEISDLSNLDGGTTGQYPGYPGFPFEVQNEARDISHEFRIATDPNKPYRALLGVSYVDSHNATALGVTQFGPDGVAGTGSTESTTSGVFFSLAYDILPQLTLNFDGRYQEDDENAYLPSGVRIAKGSSTDFLPRVSLQYKFLPDMMAYFTYSEGVNPGTFNTQYSTLPAVSQTELNTLGVAGGLSVKPEDITNYELGFKGKFFGDRATLSADVYYDKWTNQLNLETYNFPAADPANPYNVVGSSQYLAQNNSIYPYSYTDNSASSTAKGFEAEADFILFEHVTINLAGAINDTQYDSFNCTSCLPYPTTPGFNAKGKYLPNAPKDSFTGGAEYSNRANIFGANDWFIRGDYVFKDGVYIESSNTVKTPDINHLVNIRGGLNWSNFSVEAFVDNLFNDKAYTSGFQDVNFGTNFGPTVVMVGLPTLITGGVRFKFKY
jgi:iron complex outermembrane receptor protein